MTKEPDKRVRRISIREGVSLRVRERAVVREGISKGTLKLSNIA